MITDIKNIKNNDQYVLDKFKKAYKKGFIDECRKLGLVMNLSQDNIEKNITLAKCYNREEIGITRKDDEEALRALENIKDFESMLTVCTLGHDKWITIIDRLYGVYNLLLIQTPNENFLFGSKTDLVGINKKLGGKNMKELGLNFLVGKFTKEEIEEIIYN